MIFRPENIHRTPTSCCQSPQQVQIVLGDVLVFLAQRFDATAGVQNSRMVASAEGVADLREAVTGLFLRQRHRHLSRPGERTAAAW